MITLESGGMSYSKKIAYSISKIPIPRNERKQTGPHLISFLTWFKGQFLFAWCFWAVYHSFHRQLSCITKYELWTQKVRDSLTVKHYMDLNSFGLIDALLVMV
jgi:hypothetical protein